MTLEDQAFFLIVYLLMFLESCALNYSTLRLSIKKHLVTETLLVILNLLIIIFYMIMFILTFLILWFKIDYSIYFIKYAIIIFNVANFLYLSRLISGAVFIRNEIKKKNQ